MSQGHEVEQPKVSFPAIAAPHCLVLSYGTHGDQLLPRGHEDPATP